MGGLPSKRCSINRNPSVEGGIIIKTVRIVACQTLREEILKSLVSTPDQTVEVMTFSPLCHTPFEEDNVLSSLFNNNTLGIILACPEITHILDDSPLNKNVKIYCYSNCCDLLLNNELIDHLQQTGGYLVTPGWLDHWEQFLGNRQLSNNEIILLDTKLEQNFIHSLDQFSGFVGLPYKILPVGLSHLKLILSNLLQELLYEEKLSMQTETIRTLTDQALTVELISKFAEVKTQKEALDVIKTLLTDLFAPQDIEFVPCTAENQHLPSLRKPSIQWSADDRSFSIPLRHLNTDFGSLVLKEIMYPKYKDKYLNLLYQIMDISGFALSNARTFDEICKYERYTAIGEMASAIAHEIRNPMTTVRGYLQFFQTKQGVSKYKEQFNLMIEELDYANRIISEYLSLAKDRAIQPKYTNLNQVISSIHPLIKANTNQAEISIKLSLCDIPDLLIDEAEVCQLILNLTRNGIEAMNCGGTLEISTFLLDNDILLEITDHGHGISPELLSKLGTPFFTTKKAGTGLGLAVCYSIVSKYDGKITFTSDTKRTTVSVRFPLPR